MTTIETENYAADLQLLSMAVATLNAAASCAEHNHILHTDRRSRNATSTIFDRRVGSRRMSVFVMKLIPPKAADEPAAP